MKQPRAGGEPCWAPQPNDRVRMGFSRRIQSAYNPITINLIELAEAPTGCACSRSGHYGAAGTRRRTSSNQFTITFNGLASKGRVGLSIKKRRPSRETSYSWDSVAPNM